MTQRKVCGAQVVRRAILPRILLLVLIAGFALATPRLGFATYQASSEVEQEERYKAALQAYNENRLTDARTLFEGVRGSHTEEAKKYVEKIIAYRAAMGEADSVMQRSPDELDPANLDFVIRRYRDAIAIKSDGPWNAKEKLEKVEALKSKLLQQSGPATESRDRNLCDRLLKASVAHAYERAKLTACALSHDDPGYSCGGDEALHLCQEMQELAKLVPHPPSNTPKAPERSSNASQGNQTNAFDTAKTAFDSNDFDKALAAFQRVTGAETASAAEYVKKIGEYQNSMKQALKLAHDAKYKEAQDAYQEASTIKPDGPGNPQEKAGSMSLLQGVSEFYAGNYIQAGEYLATYAQDNAQRADIAHFYLGASELARFFLAGGRDENLREDGLNHFRKAKEAGFHLNNLEVSPKIAKAYDELAF